MPSRRANSDPLRIVAIGGGTGLSSLLHGLKQYMHCDVQSLAPGANLDLTAVVTVTDDGGSSGRLRRDFAMLPPGDIRNCLVAMSEDEAMLSRLFQYRFDAGKGLKGHSLGNLFLTALTDLTGDFAKAVQHASDVLATCGRIFPSTPTNVVLEAMLLDGTLVAGETKISKSRSPIKRIRLRPSRVKPMQETLDAIAKADLITLGPGSLFTSVIPNLLVKGIPEAIEGVARYQVVHHEPDVAAWRDDRFQSLGPYRSDPAACRQQAGRCSGRQHVASIGLPTAEVCGAKSTAGGK